MMSTMLALGKKKSLKFFTKDFDNEVKKKENFDGTLDYIENDF